MLMESAIDLSLIDVLVIENCELVENIATVIIKLRHSTGIKAVVVMCHFVPVQRFGVCTRPVAW